MAATVAPRMGTERITTEMSASSARFMFDRDAVDAMLVYERDRPIGALTEAALERLPEGTHASVADVMDYELVQVPPDADARSTLRTYSRAAWNSIRRRRPRADETLRRRALLFEPTAVKTR